MSKKAQRKGLDGMPLSIIEPAGREPIERLRDGLLLRLRLLEEMRPAMSHAAKAYIKEAKLCRGLALQSIKASDAEGAAWASIKTLQMAWLAEIEIGARPRIEKAISSQKQKEKATASAVVQRAANTNPRDAYIMLLLKNVPENILGNKSAVARNIQKQAQKLIKIDEYAAGVSKLSLRRITQIIK